MRARLALVRREDAVDDDVVAEATHDDVGAEPAIDLVVPRRAEDDVVFPLADQRVVVVVGGEQARMEGVVVCDVRRAQRQRQDQRGLQIGEVPLGDRVGRGGAVEHAERGAHLPAIAGGVVEAVEEVVQPLDVDRGCRRRATRPGQRPECLRQVELDDRGVLDIGEAAVVPQHQQHAVLGPDHQRCGELGVVDLLDRHGRGELHRRLDQVALVAAQQLRHAIGAKRADVAEVVEQRLGAGIAEDEAGRTLDDGIGQRRFHQPQLAARAGEVLAPRGIERLRHVEVEEGVVELTPDQRPIRQPFGLRVFQQHQIGHAVQVQGVLAVAFQRIAVVELPFDRRGPDRLVQGRVEDVVADVDDAGLAVPERDRGRETRQHRRRGGDAAITHHGQPLAFHRFAVEGGEVELGENVRHGLGEVGLAEQRLEEIEGCVRADVVGRGQAEGHVVEAERVGALDDADIAGDAAAQRMACGRRAAALQAPVFQAQGHLGEFAVEDAALEFAMDDVADQVLDALDRRVDADDGVRHRRAGGTGVERTGDRCLDGSGGRRRRAGHEEALDHRPHAGLHGIAHGRERGIDRRGAGKVERLRDHQGVDRLEHCLDRLRGQQLLDRAGDRGVVGPGIDVVEESPLHHREEDLSRDRRLLGVDRRQDLRRHVVDAEPLVDRGLDDGGDVLGTLRAARRHGGAGEDADLRGDAAGISAELRLHPIPQRLAQLRDDEVEHHLGADRVDSAAARPAGEGVHAVVRAAIGDDGPAAAGVGGGVEAARLRVGLAQPLKDAERICAEGVTADLRAEAAEILQPRRIAAIVGIEREQRCHHDVDLAADRHGLPRIRHADHGDDDVLGGRDRAMRVGRLDLHGKCRVDAGIEIVEVAGRIETVGAAGPEGESSARRRGTGKAERQRRRVVIGIDVVEHKAAGEGRSGGGVDGRAGLDDRRVVGAGDGDLDTLGDGGAERVEDDVVDLGGDRLARGEDGEDRRVGIEEEAVAVGAQSETRRQHEATEIDHQRRRMSGIGIVRADQEVEGEGAGSLGPVADQAPGNAGRRVRRGRG